MFNFEFSFYVILYISEASLGDSYLRNLHKWDCFITSERKKNYYEEDESLS